MTNIDLKRDKFKIARGTWSRLLNISCRKCKHVVAVYQKDGSGNLRRLYFDRIFSPKKLVGLQKKFLNNISILKCGNCSEILGTPYVYQKEHRKAFRLYQDAVIKHVKRLKA